MGSCLGSKKKEVKQTNEIRNPEDAEKLKIQGNELFSKGEYREALIFYQKAIRQNPVVSIFYSNSAICFYKLKEFGPAYSMSKAAWDIDKNNTKALVYCIKSSASLALKGNSEQFNIAMAHCKEMSSFLTNKSEIKEYTKKLTIKVEYILCHVNFAERKNNILNYYKSQYINIPEIKKLENFFEYEPVIINSLFCPLTLEPFEKPICISSGNTFESKMIELMEKNRNFIDPLTRESFNRNVKLNNKSVIEALNWYSKLNPEIAFNFDKGDYEL